MLNHALRADSSQDKYVSHLRNRSISDLHGTNQILEITVCCRTPSQAALDTMHSRCEQQISFTSGEMDWPALIENELRAHQRSQGFMADPANKKAYAPLRDTIVLGK